MSKKTKLLLLSRVGCCLCEGLEERLKALPLKKIDPPLTLSVVNIDEAGIPQDQRDRYSWEVPVLFLELENPSQRIELPRVSPRLSEELLFSWLEKIIYQKLHIR